MKVSLSSWKAIGKRVALATAAIGSLLVVPSVASAAVSYTYYPSGSSGGANDLTDLDHAYYYTWNLSNLTAVNNQGIISASITFKDMYNWDANSNVLHLDLLDNASTTAGNAVVSGSGNGGVSGAPTVTSTVRSATDGAPNTPTKESDMMNDVFDTPATDILDTAGQPNHANLSDRSFVAQNTAPTSTATLRAALASLTDDIAPTGGDLAARQAWADTLISPPGWTWSSTAGVNGGYDYTYTFTGTDLSNLISYITNGGDVALAFDPDCHFYNDGISFNIVTSNLTGQNAVPEPASLLLLGTGLVVAGRYRRKAAKAKQ